jgi:NitT/TauT family transport system substrate-binding protein
MSTTIRVACMSDEVYYAPQMVAQQAGFLADEGLTLEPVLVDTCDVPAVLDSGEATIALCGMWQPWLYQERLGRDYTVFAQLNQQVPLQIYGRTPELDWASLSDSGTLLLTSMVACSPWAAVQGLMHAKGVDLAGLRTVVSFPAQEAHTLYKAGFGDIVEVFSSLDFVPFAEDPELHSIVDWERDLGRIPWSVYFAPTDRMAPAREEIVAFTRALGRAQQWLREQNADEVTALLEPFFADVPAASLRVVIDHFQRTEQWPATAEVQQDASERWRSILQTVGILHAPEPVEQFVDFEIAATAAVA